MSENHLVTDTNALIWYLTKKMTKLPRRVHAAFESAREGSGTHIWVPIAVAWELSLLMRKNNRLSGMSFEELILDNFFCKGITMTELQPDDLLIAHALQFNRDPFDALIVATAKRLELPLMTADSEIIESGSCEIFWR